MNLNPGEVVDRYQIEALVGEGGMARVYRARHTGLGTLHALKLLTASSHAVRDRLLQEGRVQASLKHPHIVSVHDIIDVEGSPGLVMEYIDGPSLSSLLHHMHPLVPAQLDAIAVAIISGVAHAHSVGIVHRDLKPANVLLAVQADGLVPKITDFGLAKLLATDPRDSATRSGVAMGTPSYMAPEQVRDSKAVGPPADIWSLGAMLYELVSGTRAFVGGDLFETYQKVTSADYTPVQQLRPDVPARMRRAIEAALQVDIEERCASAAELETIWLDGTSPQPAAWDSGELDRAAALGFGGRPWSASESGAPAFDPSEHTFVAGSRPPVLADPTFTGVSIATEPSQDRATPAVVAPGKPAWAFVAGVGVVVSLIALAGIFGAGGLPARPGPVAPPVPEPAPVLIIPEVEEPVPTRVAPPTRVDPPQTPEPVAEPEPKAPVPSLPKPTPAPVAAPAPPQLPEPPRVPDPPVPAARTTRVDVVGFDRVYLQNAKSSVSHPPGEVTPGQWWVVAMFGDQPTPSEPFDVAEGEHVQVRCTASMGQCRVQR